MRLVRKLLSQHLSVVQLAGFFVANLIGMVVILAGVQIYADVKPLIEGDDKLFGKDFIVISKPAKMMGDITFDAKEVEEIGSQPFVKDYGEFLSSQYRVDASLNFMGRGIRTHMFFESVPDRFLDVDPALWRYDEQTKMIPIILPRSYINLYNLGFSTARGLPQISEGAMKAIQIQIRINKGGRDNDVYSAEIVDFTDDINTILVPESFMRWANEHYVPEKEKKSSRVIVEVDNPADSRIPAFLKDKGYLTEGKGDQASKAMFLLKVCVAVIVAIGAIFSILSMFILTLSIYLLVEKNSEKMANLCLIGYTPARVARPYTSLAAWLNITIVAVALAAVWYLREAYTTKLGTIIDGIGEGSMHLSILCGVAITLAIIIFNAVIIRRKVNLLARKK